MNWYKSIKTSSNYGSLQKDDRIKRLGDRIKKDMLEVIEPISKEHFGIHERQIHHKFEWMVYPKHKNKSERPIWLDVVWVIDFRPLKEGFIFGGGSHLQVLRFETSNTHQVTIYAKEGMEKEKLIEAVLSGDIDKWLLHEVKHLLDVVDGSFSQTSQSNYTDSYKNYAKYMTQGKEFDAFIVTMIEDLRYIKKKNPNISFEDALNESSVWPKIYGDALKGSKDLNKFKSKLAHFWTSSFGPKKSVQKPDLNMLKAKAKNYLMVLFRSIPNLRKSIENESRERSSKGFHRSSVEEITKERINNILERYDTEEKIIEIISYAKVEMAKLQGK